MRASLKQRLKKIWYGFLRSGKKYHSKASCSGMKNPWQVTVDEAISQGKEPCEKMLLKYEFKI